jgi:hypothetical protein
VGLPNEVPAEESEPQQDHVRSENPSPNRKRPSTCLAETGKMAAITNQRGNAIGSSLCSSVETDCGGLDEEDESDPPPVNSSALIGSDPDQEVVQDKATRRQVAATKTNQRGKVATDSCSSVKKEDGGGRDEDSTKPSLVASSALVGSYPRQEVVQEEAPTPDEIPSGWTRVKLEPDC